MAKRDKALDPERQQFYDQIERAIMEALGRIELRMGNVEATVINMRREITSLKEQTSYMQADLASIKSGDYCILQAERQTIERAVPNLAETMRGLTEELRTALSRIEDQVELLGQVNGRFGQSSEGE